MTELETSAGKAPGIVIFVAILNFITAAFLFLLAGLCLAVLIFGNILSLYEFVSKQITQVSGQATLGVGLNVIFGTALIFGLAFALFYLFVGLGLLKGRKLAWYFQVALSAIGLLGFPLGTILNGLILVFFFLPNTRAYFRI